MAESMTMSVEELAPLLGRKPDTIRAMIKQNIFPFARCFTGANGGNQYLIMRPAFDHWAQYGDTTVVNDVRVTRDDFDTLAKAIVAR